MNWILDIPLAARLAVLFVIGAGLGSLVNLAAYRLALDPRPIGPWSRRQPEAPPRKWYDWLPIVGWLGLRREAGLFGPGFWVRPMVVEVLCGLGCAALYWLEIEARALVPGELFRLGAAPPTAATLHVQFACHVLLVALMLAASLIDLDEKIIPDSITVPGTLLGLVLAAVCPWSLLPVLKAAPPPPMVLGMADTPFSPRGRGAGGEGESWAPFPAAPPGPPPAADFLRLTSPNVWPPALDGFPHAWPLALALACYWAWCLALMNRTWYARHGLWRAVNLMLARLRRDQSTGRLVVLGLLGSAGIAAVWFLGGDHWAGLLTALVGLAASGGLVWAVRVIGTAVLNREAMGFGDVTLMAMIGAFLGWQACLMVFFLAPFAGLILGLLTLLLYREREIPYGPFLCLAALVVIVRWAALWNWASPVFSLGSIIPLVVLACLVLMGLMLGVIRLVRERAGGEGE